MEAPDPKQRIAEILNIENSEGWSILDSRPEDGLYLVHYAREADTSRFGSLRGTIVDIKAGTLVANSFGYSTSVILDEVKDEDGKINFVDVFGKNHSYDARSCTFHLGFEGASLRVFYHGGKVYASSNRKLDAANSKWSSSSPSFLAEYKRLGGPLEPFFDPSKKYSPYVHVFIVVVPGLLDVTKENIGDGYLVYVKGLQTWSQLPGYSPFPEAEVDPDYRQPAITQDIEKAKVGEGAFFPGPMSLEQVNYHLRYGYYQAFDDSRVDPRLRTGEFVMLYVYDEKGAIDHVYRIESTPYNWRKEIRGGEAVLRFRFFSLADDALSTTSPEDFREKYPLAPNVDVEAISAQLRASPMYFPPNVPSGETPPLAADISTFSGRLYTIWFSLLMAVPPSFQAEVLPLLEDFYKTRESVATSLRSLLDQERETRISRARILVENASNAASRRRSRRPLQEEKRAVLDRLVKQEKPSSIYRLARDFENERRAAERVRRNQPRTTT